MLTSGVRVVRGPDWIWQDQDGGEGFVGTVREIGRAGSKNSPEKTVLVNWDSGNRTNYRVGYQGQFDLIVIDNAQIGVKHPNIICNGCSKQGIAGIRFRCSQCQNYDLCAMCYGNDVHDLDHSFIRYQTANSAGIQLPPRHGALRIRLQGIFVGSKVVRGPDWEWGQQDGGEGKVGRVLEIRGWDNESCRSVANVSWSSGSINVYRLGHQGNVDLKFVQPADGGYYYRDHMPILGQTEEQQQPVAQISTPSFNVGDRVKVCLEKDGLLRLQQGHGGWNPRMNAYLSKVGIVHRITDKGDIRVQYEGCANRWTFHPAALVRVHTFNVGDIVTVINDIEKVKEWQKDHGEWVDAMAKALGKTGKVLRVYADGDIRIQSIGDSFAWTMNPKCVRLEQAAERSNSMMDLSNQRQDHVLAPLSGLSGTSAADKLVREAAQGKLEYVRQYLTANPEQVDVMSGGKTCLQVAAHQGHVQIVRYLLQIGANVNIVDKEGDSTLHYAAFGIQPEIMRILLQNGADVNVVNASHCSALHISAHKTQVECVKALLDFNIDVNIQDSYGDTALHDAIGKENMQVVDLLCSVTNIDFAIKNNRGFNALQHASLKGNGLAARRILLSAPQMVNLKKDDGFSALHLAALNGHEKVIEILHASQAEIDIRNNRRQTPFLLAVSQGHTAVIELLINLGCDISAKDEDGDNAMNLCIIKKANLVQNVSQTTSPEIWRIFVDLSHINENRIMYAILCYLAKKGCPIETTNKSSRFWSLEKSMQDLILGYRDNADGDMAAIAEELRTIHLSATTDGIGSNQTTPVRRAARGEPSSASPMDPRINESVSNPNVPKRPSVTDTSNNSTVASPIPHLAPLESQPTEPNCFSTGPGSSKSGQPIVTQQKKQVNNFNATNSEENPKILNNNANDECIVCNEKLPLMYFMPCTHRVSCDECGIRMKKCITCGVVIEKRISANGKVYTDGKATKVMLPSNERLKYLESKVMEIEESMICSICMEKKKNVAFLCGHSACSRCADTLGTCHMCRKRIIKKINLY